MAPLFDLRTLIVFSVLSALMMSISTTMLWRAFPRESAFAPWALGALGITLGVLFLGGRGFISDFVSIVVGNSVLAMSISSVHVGFRRFTGAVDRGRWMLVVGLLTALVMARYSDRDEDVGARMLWMSGVFVVVLSATLFPVWKLRHMHRPTAMVTLLVFGLGIVVYLVRAWGVLASGPKGDFFGLKSLPLTLPFAYAVLLQTWFPVAVGQFVNVRLQDSLRRAREQAEAASGAKTRFLATMSHEIRTPMNGVINLLGLAREGTLPPESREYVEGAHQSALSLLGILNDILDFSRLEADRVELEQVPFSLSELLSRVEVLFGPGAQAKALSLAIELDAGLPARVVGDPLRLMQVLGNLVGNAVKFTQRGGVRLQVRAAPVVGGQVQVSFSVEDTGPGLSSDVTQSLFVPFTQADASTTRHFGGTGLGLSICQRLVGLMGGQLSLESELGRGSRFFFTVGLLPATEATPAPAVEALPPVLLGLEVLLVDDSPTNLLVARRLLERHGVKVLLAAGGREALACVEGGGRPQVVFMDLQMPEFDGFETTRRLRAMPGFGATPIIALTADVFTDRDRCLEAGMNDYLSKPIDPRRLYALVAQWAQRAA